MGCYDLIVGNFVCPYCGRVERVVLDQTKEFGCNFKDLGLGDLCSNYIDNETQIKDRHVCCYCKERYSYSVEFSCGIMAAIHITDEVFDKNI
jgi:hypothetical protein